MKALTLTQPWASLVALQQKRIETRSWSTNYRGELMIHAAKGFPRFCKELCEEEPFATALGGLTAEQLPLSRGLCIVRLVQCFRTEDLALDCLSHNLTQREVDFGDYSEGRFAWFLEYVRPIETAAVRGALGLWNWEAAHV